MFYVIDEDNDEKEIHLGPNVFLKNKKWDESKSIEVLFKLKPLKTNKNHSTGCSFPESPCLFKRDKLDMLFARSN